MEKKKLKIGRKVKIGRQRNSKLVKKKNRKQGKLKIGRKVKIGRQRNSKIFGSENFNLKIND